MSDAQNSAGSANCLAIGTRLAEFEITGVIGEGGFGIVYLALDHALQRTVAIKEYMPAALAARGADFSVAVRSRRHGEAFEAGLRSFINEARLLAQFEHSGLIKVHRFWEQHQTAYMAMRYYEGQTFKDAIRQRPELVNEAWLKAILKPILEGLDALYQANILHRDISPENIMLQPNGDVVLLDFGAARRIVTGLTQSLTVILKPGYAPVEQYADDNAMTQGPWTDIYSLSAVMYAAISGKPPPAAVARMLSDPIEALQAGDHPGFCQDFLNAINRGLAVRPEERPQTIAEFAALLGLDMNMTNRAQAPTPAAPPAKPRRKAWPLLAGAGAVVLAIGAVMANRPAAPPPVVVASVPVPIPVAQTISAKEEIISPEDLKKELASAPKPAPAKVPALDKPKPVAAASAPAKPQGALALSIKPWGNVFIDGQAKGVSPPLKQLSLTAGKHRVRIVNPHFAPYETTITVDAKTPVTISRDFSVSTP